MGSYRIISASDLATKPLPVLRTRNTISSSAELDGAQTNTWARYLRLELTTSGFYREMFCLVRGKNNQGTRAKFSKHTIQKTTSSFPVG
jgi:hypothetical protein